MKNNEKVRGIAKTNMEVGKLQKRWKRIELGLIAVGLSIALLLTAAIPVCEAKPDEQVVVGLSAGFTGPLADTYLPLGTALLDYFKYLNERGGINGTRLEVCWSETQELPGRTFTAYKRAQAAGAVLYLENEGSCMAMLMPRFEKDEIPGLGVNAHMPTTFGKPPWVFMALSSWGDMSYTSIEAIKKYLWAEARLPRIGVIIMDVTPGWNYLDGVKASDRLGGSEFVGYEVVPIPTIDTSVEWLRLARKGADWILCQCYASVMVTAVKDAHRLDIRGKGIGLLAATLSLAGPTIRAIGEKALEGWYSLEACARGTEIELEGIRSMAEVCRRYHPYGPEYYGGAYVLAWVTAMVAAEAIRVAIEQVGLENLTGKAVRRALETGIRDLDTGGLTLPLTMSGEYPCFIHALQLEQAQNGVLVPIADYMDASYLIGREF